MPQSTIEQEKLKQGLLQDLAEAQDTVKSSAGARGVDAGPQDETVAFSPKAIRYKNKIMGQAEIAELDRTIATTIDKLASTTDFANATEQTLFKQDLQRKFNKFKLDSIRAGTEMEVRMAKRGYDQAQRQAIIGAFAGVLGGVAQGAAIKSWRAPTPPKITTTTPAATEEDET